MKALSILVVLCLAALASATQVEATPYGSLYAWFLNVYLEVAHSGAYLGCLSVTAVLALVFNDGGNAFKYCLSRTLPSTDRYLKAVA